MSRTIQNHVSTYIDDALLLSLDRLAASLGKSRSSTVKWVLQEFQPGMDMISEAIENLETDKEQEVSDFLRLLSKASALIGEKNYDLAREADWHKAREAERRRHGGNG